MSDIKEILSELGMDIDELIDLAIAKQQGRLVISPGENEIKRIIKEMFKERKIKIKLQQEKYSDCLSSDYTKVTAQVIIDGGVVQESNTIFVKSFD